MIKLALEIAVSIVLHPVAMVLAWINILARRDLSFLQKIIWGVIAVIWGAGPILYILLGNGTLW